MDRTYCSAVILIAAAAEVGLSDVSMDSEDLFADWLVEIGPFSANWE